MTTSLQPERQSPVPRPFSVRSVYCARRDRTATECATCIGDAPCLPAQLCCATCMQISEIAAWCGCGVASARVSGAVFQLQRSNKPVSILGALEEASKAAQSTSCNQKLPRGTCLAVSLPASYQAPSGRQWPRGSRLPQACTDMPGVQVQESVRTLAQHPAKRRVWRHSKLDFQVGSRSRRSCPRSTEWCCLPSCC